MAQCNRVPLNLVEKPSCTVAAGASDRKMDATVDGSCETGPWDDALATLREWDPEWAETCAKMTTNPWRSTVLPRKTVELIGVALNAACTNLNPEGTRRHIRVALRAGASREEILMVLKMASVHHFPKDTLSAGPSLAAPPQLKSKGQKAKC